MAIPSGTKFGSYEVVAQIGAGGMGEVCRALDTRIDRTVAIKARPNVIVLNANGLARFQHRAKVPVALNHLKFRQSSGRKRFNGVHFLIMEPVFGWVKRSSKRKDFR